MADENPSNEPASTNPSEPTLPKRETVRLNTPPRPDEGPMKSETVRIKQSGRLGALGDAAPKKESSRLSEALPPPGAGAPPTMPKPFVPTPIAAPKPPAPLASKPLSGAPPAPSRPPVIAKPTVPLRPSPATEEGAPKPLAMKGATPKKETARIQVPPEPRPPMPKATVKMQPTQLISQAPAPVVRSAEAPLVAAAAGDSSSTGLAVGVFITSLFALAMSLWVYLS